MRYLLSVGAVLVAASTSVQANPWDVVPPTTPYKNIADAVKASTKPGQPSALNPSCEGMTGDACTRSEESSDKSRPKKLEAFKSPPPKYR